MLSITYPRMDGQKRVINDSMYTCAFGDRQQHRLPIPLSGSVGLGEASTPRLRQYLHTHEIRFATKMIDTFSQPVDRETVVVCGLDFLRVLQQR